MRDEPLGIPLLSSCFIHVVVILVASIIMHNSKLLRQEFMPISLVDVPQKAKEIPIRKEEMRPEIKKPPPPRKIEKAKETKREIIQPERPAPPAPAPVNEEPERKAMSSPSPRVETGGSEAGAGNLFGKGDVGVVPGSGTSGGGGGTADAGLGKGSGAPGPPEPTILRTNRLAKPIQSVRPVYPPLALKMGMQADVTLKIIVDAEGNVSRAEIVKSGGTEFDEEALKAVKQSRFEPAQKDGRAVADEFTYIYRFRLQR
jgi:protein TonB